MEGMPKNCFASINREPGRVVAQLLLPNGEQKIKRFPETEVRAERRLALSWVESAGRQSWGSRWSDLRKNYIF